MTLDFSSGIMQARKQQNDIFLSIERKSLYSAKMSLKTEDEIPLPVWQSKPTSASLSLLQLKILYKI